MYQPSPLIRSSNPRRRTPGGGSLDGENHGKNFLAKPPHSPSFLSVGSSKLSGARNRRVLGDVTNKNVNPSGSKDVKVIPSQSKLGVPTLLKPATPKNSFVSDLDEVELFHEDTSIPMYEDAELKIDTSVYRDKRRLGRVYPMGIYQPEALDVAMARALEERLFIDEDEIIRSETNGKHEFDQMAEDIEILDLSDPDIEFAESENELI